MLHDLDAADYLVGVGEFDPVAPEHARIVGDLHSINYEALLSLRPTAVLVQPGVQGLPARLETLADRVDFAVHSYDIETLEDALAALESEVGQAVDLPDEAATLAAATRERMREIARLSEGREQPRVLLLVGMGPYVTAAAPGTFLDEALAAAGGRNALGDRPVLYPELDHEQLLAIDPDVLIYLTSHARPNAADHLPTPLNERLAIIDLPYALLPSTSLPRVTARMTRVIHPDLAEDIEEVAPPATSRDREGAVRRSITDGSCITFARVSRLGGLRAAVTFACSAPRRVAGRSAPLRSRLAAGIARGGA